MWLAVVLALVALGAALTRPQPAVPPSATDFRFTLALAPAQAKDSPYVLELRQTATGARWLSWFQAPRAGGGPGKLAIREGELGMADFLALRASLETAGIWTVPDATEDAPGALHTRLFVCAGTREHRSTWIGLPQTSHIELSKAFLNGPLGKEIQEGLSTAR